MQNKIVSVNQLQQQITSSESRTRELL